MKQTLKKIYLMQLCKVGNLW